MEELTPRPARGREPDVGAPEVAPGAPSSAADVGLLGKPLRGDETAELGAMAPAESVSPGDDEVAPSRRRFGEGVTSDSPNFQGRHSPSVPGGGADSAGEDGDR